MDLEQPIQKSGFNLAWQNSNPEITNTTDDFYQMRNWQLHAFDKLKSEPYMILNAPMGSGKSWMMCLLSYFKMKQDSSLRCIIVVPQTIIASGFCDAKFQMPDGEKIHWQIKHNLCKDELSKGTVNYFIKWLENSSTNFSDRALLCTHATLVTVYKKLKSEHRLNLFKDILLWVDEAHHVKNITVEGFENTIINNGIGEVVTYILDNSSKNLQIGLTTASFFRGDRASLLTDNMEEKFKRFNLPYDEYLRSMKYLKSFSFDFLLSGTNYIKAIELLIQNQKSKDIIYIPHPISQYSTGNKHQEVETIINIYGKKSHITEDGLMIVHGESGEQKILDLVNEAQRKQKKNYLDNPIVKKESSALDAIITLGMFKEGANWVHANRSIIVGARSSLVDVIQMVGRLFRDAENKHHVEVIQLLPFSLDQKDETNFRENLNNYLKAIYASLILENILNPVKIRPMQKLDKEKYAEEQATKIDWLSAAFPDDSKQQLLIEEVGNRLVDIMDQKKEAISNIRLLHDEYSKIIPEILEDFGITENMQEVSKQVWGTLVRRSMQMHGISVENIDFNIIQDTHPLGFLLRYTSGTCDVNTFERLREAIALSRNFCSLEEACDFVQPLKLKSESEWELYAADKMKHLPTLPTNIPKAPWAAYKAKGWISMGAFLGTNQIAPRLRKYRIYEEANNFAMSLNLTRKEDWFLYVKGMMPHLPPLPIDIPASPDKTYKREEYGKAWNGWRNFLGINKKSNWDKTKNWMPYQEAKTFAQNLKNVHTAKDWLKYKNGKFADLPSFPDNLPKNPDQVYEEWESWPIFLGNENISKYNCKRIFWKFEKARSFVHSLKLQNQKEWSDYCAGKLTHLPPKPMEIPSNPSKKYKNEGWVDLKDWLGY